jgi:hypothetical protein
LGLWVRVLRFEEQLLRRVDVFRLDFMPALVDERERERIGEVLLPVEP